MKYRRLGTAGVKVSEIGLGGWLTFGHALGDEVGKNLITKAFECGINFFDTANGYAKGKCEEMWGHLLKPYRRSSYVLATKVFFPTGDGPNDGGLSRKHVFEQCHESLRRLKTDYIDIYQCHRFDPNTPQEETVSIMNDLVRQGKILYWGFSEWTAPQIEEAIGLTKNRFEPPKSSQPSYSMIHRHIEGEVIPACRKGGIGHVVFSPLAQGLLTGKYKPGQPLPEGSRATDETQNMFMKGPVNDQKLLQRIAELEPLAKELGCTVAQLSLAWVLRLPEISSAIIGATRPDQIQENVRAVDVKIPAKVLEKIDELFPFWE